MKNTARFIFFFLTTLLRCLRPGGVKAMAAENMVLKQQLITVARRQKRAAKLKTSDRIIFAFLTGLITRKRISKIAIILKPATLCKFHKRLVKRKYSLLFSNKHPKKPGPKGPSQELINLIIEMKSLNPRFVTCA